MALVCSGGSVDCAAPLRSSEHVDPHAETMNAREKIVLLLDNYSELIETDCTRCIDLTVLIIEMVETNPLLTEELELLFQPQVALLLQRQNQP